MTKQMPQPSLAKLRSFAALLLIAFTGTAAVLIAIGTIFGNASLEEWGAALSLPAVVATLIPLGCLALLAGIWFVRGLKRLLASTPLPSPQWTISDLMRVPALVQVEAKPSRRQAARARPLTDDEIIKILFEFDRGGRGAGDESAVGVGQPGAAATGPAHPGAADAGQPKPAGAASATLADVVADAQARGVAVTINSEKNACIVPVPSTTAAFSPGSPFEETCVALLEKAEDLNTLVMDGRGLDPSMLDSFCDLLYRVVHRVGNVVAEALCVAVSTAKTEILGPLWQCVLRNMPQVDRRAQVAVYAALLTVFLGPVSTAQGRPRR